ncbi:uncharacterized protein [Montipora foliosa]|uniref:uncharacterized protein n=1 Tax=Montipora foliosa TaxID=591990 RepID=UPI0035F1DD4F
MKPNKFLLLASLLVFCSASKGTRVRNIVVRALSSYSLQITWEPPLVTAGTLVRSYSLVFFPAQTRQRRTNVELFVNRFNLTNLRPGTRYKLKLAALLEKDKDLDVKRGVYSNWVNARTQEDNKTDAYEKDSHSTVQFPNRCSRVGELCKNIGYHFTKMPNYFSQWYQDDAQHEFSQFTSMIKSNCSSVLRVFLCSLYFPPCIRNASQVAPPCKSVCQKVKSDCEPWMKRSRFKWPYKFDCSSFPHKRRVRSSVGLDGTVVKAGAKMPPRCQKLEIDSCKGLGYSFVQMPLDVTQREAGLDLEMYSPLVATNCSAGTLRFFLCLLFAPPCILNSPAVVPPCREVCEIARRGCEQYLTKFGYTWPSSMLCSRFPRNGSHGDNACLIQSQVKPIATPIQPPAHSRCKPLTIPMCKSLNYTRTILPNFLNHTSQAEVELALGELKPHWNQCSSQITTFLCLLFAPFCTPDGTPLPLCQTFCEKMKRDCGHVSALLTNLNCSRFPTLSRGRLCFDPLITMDCVGPHSLPCKVTSTTLPVTLKCSSHFIIDEVNLYLKNRTTILLTASSSTAPQQCNQTQQEVGGRRECHFNINYDAAGIDSFSVHSVDVEYHCMD